MNAFACLGFFVFVFCHSCLSKQHFYFALVISLIFLYCKVKTLKQKFITTVPANKNKSATG